MESKKRATNSNVCLICNASIAVSTRTSCHIFQQKVDTSNQPIINIINTVVKGDVQPENAPSNFICKKCFKTCNEIDELEDKLKDLKEKVRTQYNLNHKPMKVPLSSDTARGSLKTEKITTKNKKEGQFTANKQSLENVPIADVESHILEFLEVDSDKEKDDNSDNDDGHHENVIIEVNGDHLSPHDKDLDDYVEEADDYESEQKSKSSKPIRGKKSFRKEDTLIPKMVVFRDGDNYTCLVCPVEEKFVSDSKGLIEHLKETHDIRLYICDVCGLEFLQKTELAQHLEEHVTNQDTYQCDDEKCKRVFTNFRLFRVHKKMHRCHSNKRFGCDQCEKRFASQNLLDEHKNLHTGLRPYGCNLCDKMFASKYAVKTHMKTHEARERPFSCVNCGKGFLTQQNLIHHERIHSGIRNYMCQECGMTFTTARNLETHCVVHTGYKPYICRLCGKAFSRKIEIRDHERTHSGEKPYQCEFCGTSFSQRSNLQSHKRTTHYDDKRYKCTDCGRAFKRRRLLDYHMKAAHTGERPHKCEICEATFIYPEHFKKHKLIHTGLKPYLCEVCGKAFNSRDNRNAHRFIHSDKKPYECLICGMGFMRKPQLHNHMQSAGHVNDTIIVNQPRLLPSGDKGLKMTIYTDPDGKEKLVPAVEYSSEEDKKVFIDNDIKYSDEKNLQVMVDAAQYTVQHDTENILPVGEVAEMQEITYDDESDIKTVQDGPVQIVQIRLTDADTDQKQWFNIIQGGP